jgi:hypothetical protein
MSYQSSNWTGRTPRTVYEAFNPHVRSVITEPVRKSRWSVFNIVLTVIYAAALTVLWAVYR